MEFLKWVHISQSIIVINLNLFKKLFGILFLLIIFFSCEIKFPEEWNRPNWHLPINFPLQDETYFFGGLVDSNTIFLDNDSTLFILFQDSLSGPNGERVGIDSTFNPYFRIDGLGTPDIDSVIIDPIDLEASIRFLVFKQVYQIMARILK